MLVIGLGNPGKKFDNTRHNVGFMVLDQFQKENNFPDFEMSKKHNALISEKDKVLLAKPQTFMNDSGKAVKKLAGSRKEKGLIVIHDEVDILLGKMKITKDSSAGGHKGIASVIENIGSQDFIRIKVGICPEKGKPKGVEKFVIKKFTKEEEIIINQSVAKASLAVASLLEDGLERAMNKFNG